jgi:hypothetical protein
MSFVMFDEVHVVVVTPDAVTTSLVQSIHAPLVTGVIEAGVAIAVVETDVVTATSWGFVASTPEYTRKVEAYRPLVRPVIPYEAGSADAKR